MANEYYGAASTPTDDFLAHYGVKGMKWGVRKSVPQKSNAYKKAKKKLAKSNWTEDGIYTGKVTLTKKQKDLENKWVAATKAREESLRIRNKSLLGSMGYGKKSKAYEEANKAAENAAGEFFDSMSDLQRKKYHDRYLY